MFLLIVDSAHLELVVVGGLLIGCQIRSSRVESRRLRLRHDVRALDSTFTYNSSFIS